MEWTPFAGLTALDENDAITIDGGSFLIKNPRITDLLLRVGAKTHHHDAHAALANPTTAMSGEVHASGGVLPPFQDYALTYTLVDSFGGETTGAAALLLSTGAGLDAPSVAPVAVADYTQGIMPAGVYYYGLTYTDGVGGETTLGPVAVVTVDPGYASGAVNLSGLGTELLASGGHAVSWRLWRSYEGADWHLVTEAQTNTFLDDGFDPPDNPARPPDSGNAQGSNALVVTLPTAGAEPAIADATAIRVYLAPDTNFIEPALYATLPVASAGATLTITADTVSTGSPPHVSTSLGGADKINPDTDLLDFPWKRPVATAADLPAIGNTEGDMREALDDHTLHIWDEGSSTWIETAGTGPGGAPGDPGPSGTRGSLWFPGHGAPGAIVGSQERDFYLDTDTNAYYSLIGGVWVAEGELALGSGAARMDISFATASLTPDEETTLDQAIAKAATAIKLGTDHPARVRAYPTAAYRTADASRPVGTDPTGDHGLLLEVITTGGTLSYALTPAATLWNLDGPPTTTIYFAIQNLDVADQVITVTLTVLPQET